MSNIIRPVIGFKKILLTVFIILSYLLVLPNPGAATVWTQVQLNGDGFGDSGNTAVTSMTTFTTNNFLMAGTSHLTTAQLWLYNGTTWAPINIDGFDANNTSMPSMAASGALLFVGTKNEATGAEVWMYSGGWTQLDNGWGGDAYNTVATSMIISGAYLYVVTENSNTGAEVWSYHGPTSIWTELTPNWGTSNTAVRSMAILGGYLYVGTENTSGAEVWRYNGSTWGQVQTGGFADSNNKAATSMTTGAGYLFVGTKNTSGAEVWRTSDGIAWTQVDNGWDDGSGPNPNNTAALSMGILGIYLYVGTENSSGAEVWRSDVSSNWKKEGNGWDGDASNTAITSMQVNNVSGADMLCMGFLTNQTTGSQVWRGKTYDNIQPAVNDSIAGSTVLVEAGVYNEKTLDMKTGVDVVSTWIRGVDPPLARPLITRDGGSQTVVFGSSGVSNCKLKGFRIKAVGDCGMFGTVLLAGNNSGITIEDCEIYGESQGNGILLYNRVSATIRRCTVRDIDAVGISGYRMYAKWTGGTVVIEDTEVYNCGGWMNAGPGIRLSDSDSLNYPGLVTITNCRIHNNTNAGIRLDDLSQATIDGGNVIYDNGWGGIHLNNIAQATVENNTIDNNGLGGIRIVNVDTVTISNNEIRNHAIKAGIAIEGNSAVTIGADLAASDPFLYGNNIHSNYAGIYFRSANFQPVVIRGNNIHNNSSRGGIRLDVALTGTVTITQNDIDSNNWGGISIQNNCTAIITKNNIHGSSIRGGIHTGDYTDTFSGTAGGANLTITQNKVHDNNGANYGGGIDVRHASGTIENNLVYDNSRGGIRFGDYVTEIVNNTVVNNGQNDWGGGIIYDDPTDNVSVNDRPTGTCSGSPVIINNISAHNEKAGIRVGGNGFACPADNPGYDYNLLYANYPWNDVWSRANPPACGWPTPTIPDDYTCTQQQYGGCGAYVDSGIVLNNPNDIMANPSFVDMNGDDYHLDTGAPPIGAGALGVDMGAYGGSDPMVDSEIPDL